MCTIGHIANLILHIDNIRIAIANPIISTTSKSPTITWQGAHYEFIKLITKANVSCPNMDIHKSKEVVTQESKTSITYYSMVLATNEGMTCGTICIWIWEHNLRILMHDQVPWPLIPHNKNRYVSFGNKEMICDGPITNTKSLFGFFSTLFLCDKNWINILSFTPSNWTRNQNMFLHKNNPMLLIVWNPTFLFWWYC